MSDERIGGFEPICAPRGLMDEALARRERRDRRRGEVRRVALAAAISLAIGGATGWIARGEGAAPADPSAAGPIAAVSTASGAGECTTTVRFVYHAPQARSVSIAGTFNGWNPETLPMIRGQDGVYYAVVELPRGRYEYMLVVDGEWVVDPAAPVSTDDGFGRRNGILEV